MITLHRLNGDALVLNAELIETLEATPDTLITLVDRRRIMVAEPITEVVEMFMDYRRAVSSAAPMGAAVTPSMFVDD
ncbi:MAG: flagellar FlbD family protein [Thermoleophilia bacterium]